MTIGIKQSRGSKIWHDVTWSEMTGTVAVQFPLTKEQVVLGKATSKEGACEVAREYCSKVGDEFKGRFW